MKIDIGQHYMCNYCPKLEKLNPWPPKPLNIGIGQSFNSSGSTQSPKKNGVTATLLLSNLANIDQKVLWKQRKESLPTIFCVLFFNWQISFIKTDEEKFTNKSILSIGFGSVWLHVNCYQYICFFSIKKRKQCWSKSFLCILDKVFISIVRLGAITFTIN